MRTVLLLLIATLVSLAAADAAEWPITQGTPDLRGWTTTPVGDAPTLAWTYEAKGGVYGTPVVHAGVIYVGSDDGTLAALDLTGKELWSLKLERLSITASPTIAFGHAYLTSMEGTLVAVNLAEKKEAWRAESDDKIPGVANTVTASDGQQLVVFGSYDNTLYCHKAVTGERTWSYTTDNYINGTPAIYKDYAIVGGCDATLHVVDVKTGEAAYTPGVDSYIGGSAAIAWPLAYVGMHEYDFGCFNLETGEAVWSFEGEAATYFSIPAVSDEHMVIGGRDFLVRCVDRKTGKQLWQVETDGEVETGLVIAGDKAIVGGGDGIISLLAMADGKKVWSYETGGAITAGPAILPGLMLVGSGGGTVYAFKTK